MDDPGIRISFRMRQSLKTMLEARAEGLGLSLGAVIEDTTLESLGLPRDPRTALLIEVARWLQGEFSTNDFPPWVVVEVFKFIQQERISLYEEASVSGRIHLNRQIARCVRRCLRAEKGDRVKSDPRLENSLLGSYVKLYPNI